MTTAPDDEPHDEEEATESTDESDHDGSVNPEPFRLAHSSPKTFYARLRSRLSGMGINLDALDSKTSLEDPPPCFALKGASYREWLRAASVEVVPIRPDMPGEPNYCHDCTPEFKNVSMCKGMCLFPNTRFEVRIKGEGAVGVSRSRMLPPESYIIYQECLIPLDAIKGISRASHEK